MTLPMSHDDQPARGSVPAVRQASRGRGSGAPASMPSVRPKNERVLPAAPSISASSGDIADAPSIASLQTQEALSEQVSAAILEIVGERDYRQWFQSRCRFQVANDQLQVFVPNPFLLKWMTERFRAGLTQVAARLLGPSGNIQFEIDRALAVPALGSSVSAEAATPTGAPAGTVGSGTVGSGTVSGEGGGSGSFQRSLTMAARKVERAKVSNEQDSGEQRRMRGRRRFRSFDSFVTGECNGMAAMAAMQVAGTPGDRYNPLFVYGSTGTGKTHLLEAIYSEVRKTDSAAQVMYLTSEGFTNYFTTALREKSIPSFRHKFRNVDVLLIDNIEFLDNKRATQEEFLHTIVQVIEHGGQVVISSDRHPRMLTRQREELTTRFLSGLVCRMDVPDEETRRKMVSGFVAGMQVELSADAIDYVVRHCSRGVREIQGALNQLEGCYRLQRKRVSGSRARQLLGSLHEECQRLVRISDVEKVICDAFGISAADLRSSSRRRLLAVPRAIAMFLSRRMTGSAYREIGMYFGGRDHSTVVAAEKKIARQVSDGDVLGLATAVNCRTIGELLHQLEQQLLSAAT